MIGLKNRTSMHTKRQLSDMRQEHEQWQVRRPFYKDEITHFCNHLGRLAGSGVARDEPVAVKQFEGKFVHEEHQIEAIRNDFKKHETLIRSLDEGVAPEPDEGIRKVHNTQREKLERFERMFHELRSEFNVFLDRVDKDRR